MIRPHRLLLTLTLAAVIPTTALLLCANAAPTPATTEITATTAPTNKAPHFAFPAMTYYDDACSNCHGPEGASYGPSLGRHLDDKGLIKVCKDMAAGPSQSPITGTDLDTETAFHRALILGNPFLSVTKIDGNTWSGEVMVDSKVTLHVGKKDIPADVSDWNWTATVPEGTTLKDVTITATCDDNHQSTTLHPAHAMYSNTTPLPPPDKRNKK